MTALTWLELDELQPAARADYGWQHLSALRGLQHLSLPQMRLADLPAVLSHLTAQTSLNLRGNFDRRANQLTVRGGWHHLLAAQSLALVDLRGF